ncbi:MAG: AAA family ATPase, partial [Pseudomonadota bacterium]|nr:AAA family ATPase [Pseudomonadota bacterium]
GVQDPRGAKGDDVSDLVAWQRTAADIGYRHRSVLRPDAIVPMADRTERLEAAYQAALPVLAKQFARRAVIDGAEVRICAAKGLIASGIEAADDVTTLTGAFRSRGVQQNGEATTLIWGKVCGEGAREKVAVTTALHEREENWLIGQVRAAAADRSGALTPAQITAAIAEFPELDFASTHGRAQRRIIETLGQGGRFGLAIGVAGSGKSTLLKPLVRAWTEDGRIVFGVALAWRQSDELAQSGIAPANTQAVEPFLRAMARGRLAPGRDAVVVVDEIGLIGTRQLNEILLAQSRLGFQLVALGDPKQMQAVEAGPVIDLITRALGADAIAELGSSVRQKEADERETVLMFRNGQTEEAIARKVANGTLRIVPGGYQEAVAEIVTLWEARRAAHRGRAGFSITISAPTNQDAHAISAALRLRRRALGEIGEDQTVLRASDAGGLEAQNFDLPLASGDRVRLFRRTNAVFAESGAIGNIGRNGSVLEVQGISEDGLMLRAATGREGFVPWKNLRDPATGLVLLAYGEALTTHTAQGSTVTEHIHAMPAGSRLVSAFGAYTSGSRHREESFIVTSDGAERAEIAGRRPLGDRREIVREDVIANIVRNLSRQPLKEASLGLIARARDVRRGAVRG